jgi:hypothetical protein
MTPRRAFPGQTALERRSNTEPGRRLAAPTRREPDDYQAFSPPELIPRKDAERSAKVILRDASDRTIAGRIVVSPGMVKSENLVASNSWIDSSRDDGKILHARLNPRSSS